MAAEWTPHPSLSSWDHLETQWALRSKFAKRTSLLVKLSSVQGASQTDVGGTSVLPFPFERPVQNSWTPALFIHSQTATWQGPVPHIPT